MQNDAEHRKHSVTLAIYLGDFGESANRRFLVCRLTRSDLNVSRAHACPRRVLQHLGGRHFTPGDCGRMSSKLHSASAVPLA